MMSSKKFKSLFIFILLFGLSQQGQAEIDITITQGNEQALPIAIIPFGWSQGGSLPPIDIAQVIRSNLSRSGRFNPMEEQDLPQKPTEASQINFQDWRLLGMDNILIGNLALTDSGNYKLSFQLFNVFNQKKIEAAVVSARGNKASLRRAAHEISDIIYEEITGVRGAFSTRIAYIAVNQDKEGKKIHTLHVADADGFNDKTLLTSAEPLLSPSWSPDGSRLAYVSFESRNSSIYIQDVVSGKREQIQASPGINSAPTWSPDGSRLAMTLSKDGNPEIYIKHISTGLLQRVTKNPGIDTEPSWSPDGLKLAFTSDRTGGPQIYEVDVEGGRPKRLSFEGSYNARPIYSPDGKTMAIVHGNNNGYRIAIMERSSGSVDILTKTKLDESPSFAPNGHMIIYATAGFRGTELAAVSSDGRVHQRLGLRDKEVREPAWGPFLK